MNEPLTKEEEIERYRAEQDALSGEAQAQQAEQEQGEWEAQQAAEMDAEAQANSGPQGEY
jgi:hypothetical protein